jgi:hypothetical protein
VRLQAVYRCLPTRMRAAGMALPFERPKLQATAIMQVGEDFAAKLDRALDRSAQMKVFEHRAEPEPQVRAAEMNAPFATLRRRA